MRHESVRDDGHVVLEEECGCAASNGFFKTCERHDDLKTLSEMKAYLALRKSLLRSAAEAQERFNEGSRERYNKGASPREDESTLGTAEQRLRVSPKTGEVRGASPGFRQARR
jgi:hypothetical protein